jgi:hypothetical protein
VLVLQFGNAARDRAPSKLLRGSDTFRRHDCYNQFSEPRN